MISNEVHVGAVVRTRGHGDVTVQSYSSCGYRAIRANVRTAAKAISRPTLISVMGRSSVCSPASTEQCADMQPTLTVS